MKINEVFAKQKCLSHLLRDLKTIFFQEMFILSKIANHKKMIFFNINKNNSKYVLWKTARFF